MGRASPGRARRYPPRGTRGRAGGPGRGRCGQQLPCEGLGRGAWGVGSLAAAAPLAHPCAPQAAFQACWLGLHLLHLCGVLGIKYLRSGLQS